MNLIEIKDSEFKKISQIVYDGFGINLTEKKKALVRGRLNKLILSLNFKSFSQYYEYVLEDKSGKRLLHMIDKISTNHSYFFRESDHFSYLQEVVLPQICKIHEGKDRDIRIWCAGCASGQEAYTLAILVKEYFATTHEKWNPSILATDISLSSLENAVKGYYSTEGISGVPKQLLPKYFNINKDGSAIVKDELKKLILFKRLNFMDHIFPFKNKFDLIFCRNVMIYFDNKTKKDLVNKFHKYMGDRSWLFIGHSETLGRENDNFQYVQPSAYIRLGSK